MERLTRNSYPGILCGIVILILTGLPGSLFPRVKPTLGIDKIVHVVMYAGFAFACLWGYRKQFVSNSLAYKRRAILMAIIILVILFAKMALVIIPQSETKIIYNRF